MVKDILKLNVVELRGQALDLKKKLAQLRFDKATGKLVDTTVPGKVKKDIARILTRESQIKSR